jgi:hypothetical protein
MSCASRWLAPAVPARTTLGKQLSLALNLPLCRTRRDQLAGPIGATSSPMIATNSSAASMPQRVASIGCPMAIIKRPGPSSGGRATHLVWLDYQRYIIMRRVIGRSVARAWDQRELWAGNRERWMTWLDPEHPIRWAWSTWKDLRAQYEGTLQERDYAHLTVLRLRHPREASSVAARLSGAIR